MAYFGKSVTDPAELLAIRKGFVPAASRATCQHVVCKAGDAQAWIWTNVTTGKPCAVAFMGKSAKPCSGTGSAGSPYRFSTPERRAEWVKVVFANAIEHAERKAKESQEKAERRAAGHSLELGDVLRCSWGYDQTNIDYFQVTKIIGRQMVEYRKIACEAIETASMQGESVPSVGEFIGEAKRARVSDYGDRDSVKIYSFANAYKMQPHVLPGGVKVFRSSHWTAYA